VQTVEAAPAPGLIRLADREREHISQVLKATRNNIKKAAEILDVPHTSLWRKIKKYGLSS
jgi:two-component system, NtrC family, response regulator AtoC